MEQLLRVTTNNFQSIKFSQNAKLVPNNSIDIERRKAMARHMAFRARHAQNTSINVESVNKINKAFHTEKSVSNPIPTTESVSKAEFMKTMATTTTASYHIPASSGTEYTNSVSLAETASYYLPESSGYSFSEVNYQQQSQSSYFIERGSFEMRVASGEISYVPALEMTIVTQYPSIEFEYIGGFNYLPPLDESDYSFVNLSI